MILCSSFIAPSFLERNTVAAVHYRRTSRATFIQDVLVEIASVFAPSRYKFIRSLSATERPIRRSINVASPRATRGRGTIRIVGLLLPSTPPLSFLCSIFSTVSSLSLFELPSLISSTPTPTETVRWTRTVSLHNTARDNKFGGWRNRYRYSLGMNNREGDRMEWWSCAESVCVFVRISGLIVERIWTIFRRFEKLANWTDSMFERWVMV